MTGQERFVLFEHADVLDPQAADVLPDRRVLVRGEHVAEVGGRDVTAPAGARVVDVRGGTLMPGLVDAHVHVTAVAADLAAQAEMSPMYVAARAAAVLRGMLARGFTTVRDVGGADHGLAQAVDEGLLPGPRLLFGGKALSQTGGHGDLRPRGRLVADQHPCCPGIGLVCDGVDEVRRGAREQLRTGADHIKVMLSGGIGSPTDRIDSTQFSVEEIRAAVEEAAAAGRYAVGHAYTAASVNRGLAAGVRSIEHGNLLDDSSVELFRRHGAFYVPTLVTYRLSTEGDRSGVPAGKRHMGGDLLRHGLGALERVHRAGVPIAYGTDLLADLQHHQLREFVLRAEVQPPAAIVRSATSTAAELLRDDRIGRVAVGARADLIVVDGQPLTDIGVLARPERHLKLVMKAGVIHHDTTG